MRINVNLETFRAAPPFPRCPRCGALARPNILMFGDSQWDSARTDEQFKRYKAWLCQISKPRVLAIELGAGTAIPTVRHECEELAGHVIRINPRDTSPPRNGVVIPLGARAALEAIDERVRGARF